MTRSSCRTLFVNFSYLWVYHTERSIKVGQIEDKILKTEFSEEFVKLCKNRMLLISYHKYGAVKTNYGEGLVSAIESLKLRLAKYEETGNVEYLADVSNFAMIEFMQPQHPNAHFMATDSDKSPGLVGMSINQIRRFKESGE
jgi:hypothetical protein